MEKSVDTLSEYGSTFQTKTISCLLSDTSFLNQTYDILSPDLFDSEARKWIIEKILEYYDEYDKPPTTDYLEAELKDVESETLQISVVDQTRSAWNHRDDDDLEYIKDEFLEFARNQRVKLAVLNSLDSIREKEYGVMMDRIKEAMNSGMSRDIGHVYKEEVENRLKASAREGIPTGWEIINDTLDGGLAPGELGVIVAPSGAGKCIGRNTKIEIEYEQIGMEIGDKTIWFDPWDMLVTDEGAITVWEFKKYCEESEIKIKKAEKEVKIGNLFDDIGVSEEPYDENTTNYDVRVKTPYGYKKITDFFRTEEQETITLYFRNNKTLECSRDHKLKVNGEWKKAKNIEEEDLIETKKGVTSIKKVKNKGKKKLYDISVKDVHCYYSNDTLSHNSWNLAHIGLSAVKRGYNVAHYTLELDQHQTGLRYDSLLSGYPPNEAREHKEEIQEAVNNLEGDLTVKYYPTKSASVRTVHAHYDKQQAIRGRPDVILIDYADLLAAKGGDRSDNTYLQMGNIYNQLRKLAGELQVPVWTVSQATRSAIDEDVIEADMIADSYKKIMISDYIISLSRKKSDKLSNTARMHIMKNRVGRDGMVFPCIMDIESGSIEVYNPESKKGIEIKSKMDKSEDEAELDLLRGKYRNHKQKKNGSATSNGEADNNGHVSSDDLIEDLVEDDEDDTTKKETGITV